MTALRLEGVVGEDFTAATVAAALAKAGGSPLDVILNSGGGFAMEGAAIHAELAAHPAPVTIRVRGVAASAASLIAMAAAPGRLLIADGAMLMIHDPATFAAGAAADLRGAADDLDRLADNYAKVYAARSGKSVAHVRDLMRAETWMTASEAVAAGFADAVEAAAPTRAAAFAYDRFRRAPAPLVALARAQGWAALPPADERTFPMTDTLADRAPTLDAIRTELDALADPPAADPVDPDPAAAPTMTARRGRLMSASVIARAVADCGLPAALAADMIERGVTERELSRTIIDARAATCNQRAPLPAPERPQVLGSWDHGEGLSARMADALAARMSGRAPVSGRDFADAPLSALAMHWARAHGLRPMHEADALRVVMSGASHTSSDFLSTVVGASVDLELGRRFTQAQPAIARASRLIDRDSYREFQVVRTGAASTLEPVAENGEFTFATLNDEGEFGPRPRVHAKLFRVTEEAVANDRVGALDGIARAMTMGAVEALGNSFAALLAANSGAGQTLKDGNPVFTTGRGNLPATGATISVASISAAVTALRRRVGPGGERLAMQPRFLLVPPEQETLARQVVAPLQANQVGQVNPFAEALEILVEPRLASTTRWYLLADPTAADGLAHAYVNGAGPRVETKLGWESATVEFRCRLDFATAFIDWRAWQANPGA